MKKQYLDLRSTKLTVEQLTNVAHKLAAAVASPEDQEFFRGVLFCKLSAENDTAAGSNAVTLFVERLLKKAGSK